MRTVLAAFLILAGTGYAQQAGEAQRNPPPANGGEKASPTGVVRRLESVTWEPLQGQLTWLVSVWDLATNTAHPSDMEKYVIHVSSGTMELNGETRKFEVPEEDLRTLMEIISVYAMRSTIWWEHNGAADREAPPSVAPDGKDGTKDKNDGPKDKKKGDGQEEKPKAPATGKAVGLLQPPGL